ncbi:helix-turn-helix domain-containing protein [Leptolyngbya sp. FACHB-541]|uniref:helix-turn-helix domain-containing protein n=1 Tax=Leptolyngbya sp. FACHB-541 TaxID=2692810 RepID=UPI0016854275|nr:helix-turn-helix domain-containing protein [Leptolyngbya sp. FACHB-541]MBD1995384.1 helix-turn-helix domain-containing protein [Leptolyngbya sp. FACHB-541]
MRTAEPVEQLAPILEELEQPNPDYKAITSGLFAYLQLPGLPGLIKGKQNWQAIAKELLGALASDRHYQRTQQVLAYLDGHPKDLDQLAALTGLGRTTVHQTILALIKGGYQIERETSGNAEGRPTIAFFIQ